MELVGLVPMEFGELIPSSFYEMTGFLGFFMQLLNFSFTTNLALVRLLACYLAAV